MKRKTRPSSASRRPYKAPRRIGVASGPGFSTKLNYSVSEKKYFDYVALPGGIQNTGAIYTPTSLITRGTTSLNRLGKEIQISSFFIRFQLVHGDISNSMRCIFFIWNRSGVPVVADILQDIISNPYMSALNRDNGDFMHVIYDKTVDIGQYQNPQVTHKFYHKFKNHRAQWNEADTADRGNIFMLFISDSGAIAHPTVAFNVRTRFYG